MASFPSRAGTFNRPRCLLYTYLHSTSRICGKCNFFNAVVRNFEFGVYFAPPLHGVEENTISTRQPTAWEHVRLSEEVGTHEYGALDCVFSYIGTWWALLHFAQLQLAQETARSLLCSFEAFFYWGKIRQVYPPKNFLYPISLRVRKIIVLVNLF